MNDARPAASLQRLADRRIDRERSLLLVVDVQERLAPHVLESESLIARCTALVRAAQRLSIPTLATEHCPDQIGPLVARLHEHIHAQDIFCKTRFGAADHADFEAMIRARGRDQIIVAGMEAHVCVMQTTLGLAAKGFDVFVAGDAVGSRRERQRDRQLALDRVQGAGCALVGTETVLFEWAAAGDDPAFRDILALVKSLPA